MFWRGWLASVCLLNAAPPDVVVVGAGAGGLMTALEAARGGARVAVVDMSSVFGGHAVVSEGGIFFVDTPLQRSLGFHDSVELARRDLLAAGEDNVAGWVDIYLRESRAELHDWLVERGVKFLRVRPIAGNSVPRFHENARRGFGIVEPVYRECLQFPGIEFHWNVQIDKLLVQEGRVRGVEGLSLRTGQRTRFEARAVVLATGGFQSNRRLVEANWPAGLKKPERLLIGSGWNSQGYGLEMGKTAGAVWTRLDHQWNYPAGLPDPRYPGLERGLNVRNLLNGIWLNAAGRRFTNEVEVDRTNLARMLEQPGGRYWLVFDAAGLKTLLVSGSDWADPARVELLLLRNREITKQAQTWDELARLTGMPPDAVAETIRRFNEAIARGVDEDFGRFRDGKTTVGGQPLPRPLERPPFYALSMFAVTRKSMGGLAIDLQCRVLNGVGQAIPGLYAVGEVTGMGGFNGKAALEGTFLAPSMLQGKRTGRLLGQELGRGPVQAKAAVPPPLGIPVKSGAECGKCHALESLVRQSRPGYAHFERVHRVVIERQSDCSLCHAELHPFRAGKHHIDARSLISACERCHVAGGW